jgi:protein TonB
MFSIADASNPVTVLKRVDPVYPPDARAAGVEGTVVVTFSLDAVGRPRDVQVLESAPMLDEAALSALRQWQFSTPPPGFSQMYRFTAEFVLP